VIFGYVVVVCSACRSSLSSGRLPRCWVLPAEKWEGMALGGVFLAPAMGVGRLELSAGGQYGGFAAGRELAEAWGLGGLKA